METQKVVFSYRFAGIANLLEYEDSFPTHLAIDPNDQPVKHERDLTIAEIDKIWHSHSQDCWALVIRAGIDFCVECEARAIRIVQHPWSQFSAQTGPTVGALVTPVCGNSCQYKTFDNVRKNWEENMRAWLKGKLDQEPTHAAGTKMRDVRFTFIFPSGRRNLIHTHPLPARLCANADDTNNKAVQRAIRDELRHVCRLHAEECEETLQGVACEECGARGIHIMQIPLPSLNMPAPGVGVMVSRVCGKSECAGAIRGGTMNSMQDMRAIFGSMYGQHGPELKMMRCDSCGDWGKMKSCQRCRKVAYCDKECQRAGWKTHKPVCRA